MDANNSIHEQKITSCCPKADQNELKNSTSVDKAKTPFEKHKKTFLPLRDQDMDVEKSDHEQFHLSIKPKTEKRSKNYTMLKKDKKRLKNHTKNSLPLNNEGNDHGQLEQKQYGQSSSSKVDTRGRQANSTASKKAVTTKRKSVEGPSHPSDHDVDDDSSGNEQTHPSCHLRAKKIRLKNPTTLKKAKTPLEKNTKISSGERDEVEDSDDGGNAEQEQRKKTTGQPVEKSETTTSKQNTKNLQKSSSKLNHANKGKQILVKEQHVDNPSFPRRERATVLMAEDIRHDHRQDEYTKYTTTASQPVKSMENDENKNDEYVYRVLRSDESYTEGIYPKDANSNLSIEDHVLNGTYGTKSRFVSFCKTIDGVNELALRTNFVNRKRDVVKINLSKFDSKEDTLIDLTDKNTRDQHLHDPKALCFAKMYGEVILEPTICIPSECIEKIREVYNKAFYFTK